MSRLLIAALAAAALAGSAAAEAPAGGLTIKDAVVRATPAGVPNTAAYLTIVNGGAKADKLLSAACDCARSVEIHISHVMNGMAMMMPSGPVDIPGGGQASFAPGGRHLMIMGLKAPLKAGAVQEVTLRFQVAGIVKTAFQVQDRIASTPAAH